MIFNPTRYSKTAKSTKEIFSIPNQGGTLTYNGSVQSPSWNNYNTGYMTVNGEMSGTEVGTYTVTFSLNDKDNTLWSDYTSNDKVVEWSIQKAVISSVPTQSGYLSYSPMGIEQSPAWNNYDSTKLTIGGTSSSVNAGTYTATFTPTSNYRWWDGSTGAKNATWTMNKANQNIYLDNILLTLTADNPIQYITVGGLKTTLNVTPANDGYITTSVIGNMIAVTGISDGVSTISVSATSDNDWNGYGPITTTATVSISGGTVGPVTPGNMNSYTWEQISDFSSNGTLANYFSVGDTKSITIEPWPNFNGNTITVDAFIIGINHNSGIEGNNRVHFQIGKIDNTLISLTTPGYGTQTDDECCMLNVGWVMSKIRTSLFGNGRAPSDIGVGEGTLIKRLPQELQNVMKSVTKYTDNVGYMGYNSSQNVYATTEYMSLPSECEYFGITEYSNPNEASKQQQYDYYKNGNSRIHHLYNLTDLAATTWTRSPAADQNLGSNDTYVVVMPDGGNNISNMTNSLGVSPIFFV